MIDNSWLATLVGYSLAILMFGAMAVCAGAVLAIFLGPDDDIWWENHHIHQQEHNKKDGK